MKYEFTYKFLSCDFLKIYFTTKFHKILFLFSFLLKSNEFLLLILQQLRFILMEDESIQKYESHSQAILNNT